MCPEGKQPSKFYCNFKVHKPHEHGTAPPPERPILSGSGSIMENLGGYVAYNIQELSTKHETYLKDTPDFITLRNLILNKYYKIMLY